MTMDKTEMMALADELDAYAQRYSGDWAKACPTVTWDDLKLVVQALRLAAGAGAEAVKAQAIKICLEEAAEWDSDNIQSLKNYAGQCANRINDEVAALTPEPVKAGDEVMREALVEAKYALLAYCEGAVEGTLARINEALSTTAPQPDNGARGAPGHTDLMVSPESIDAFMEKNPLPTGANQPDNGARGGVRWGDSGPIPGQHFGDEFAAEPGPSDTAPAEPVPDAWQFRCANGEWIPCDRPSPEELRDEPEKFRRLYLHPPCSVDVEAIARVIDPQIFEPVPYVNGHIKHHRCIALTKARSIARMIEGE